MRSTTAFSRRNSHPANRNTARHGLALSTCTLALLAACGGGGGNGPENPAPAANPATPPPSAAQRGEAVVDKGVFWERGAGLRPNLTHLLSTVADGANVLSLDAGQQAWLRQRAAEAGKETAKAAAAAAPALQAAATPRRTVTGLQTFIYHTVAGTTIQPLDLSARVIEAYAPDGAGGFEKILPTAKRSDGTYAIANVPEGPHWVRLTTRWVWTSSGFVDWSFDQFGRSDLEFPAPPPAAPTVLTLNASNLAPWQGTDSLAWVVPLHGTSFELPLTAAGITNAPRPGEIALGAFGIDFSSDTLSLPLLNATKGDVAYLNQLVTQPGNGARVLSRSMVLPPLTMTSGTPSTATSGFLDITPSAKLNLRWNRAAFAQQANSVHPGAIASDTILGLSAFALSPALGTPFDAYSLVEFNTLGTGDIDFGTLRYGNPFPAGWNRTLDAFVGFRKNYLAPGATVSEPLVRGLSMNVLLDPATRDDVRLVLSPAITPPRNPLINGRSLFDNQLAVGSSPTLSWSPPQIGVPDYYFIRVLELRADGTRSTFVQTARLTTAETSMAMPPGILQPGKLYVITIAANRSGSPITQPNRNGLPFKFATLMSAIVSP
jgi:hypothetical protein